MNQQEKKVFRGEIFRGKLNQSYVAIVDVAQYMITKFCGETFMGGPSTVKFMKAFLLQKFPVIVRGQSALCFPCLKTMVSLSYSTCTQVPRLFSREKKISGLERGSNPRNHVYVNKTHDLHQHKKIHVSINGLYQEIMESIADGSAGLINCNAPGAIYM